MGDWKLIYATDESGAAVEGSVGELAEAVEAGADVKIVYRAGGGATWSRCCPSASTRRVRNQILVTATYAEALDTTVRTTSVEFVTPFALEYHIFNSNGVRWLFKGNNPDSSILPMQWFVKDYQPPSRGIFNLSIITQILRRRSS